MLKLLKQENPQILTIVLTKASDSELVIDLINEAQIFRFLNKPVNVRAAQEPPACRAAALPHLPTGAPADAGAESRGSRESPVLGFRDEYPQKPPIPARLIPVGNVGASRLRKLPLVMPRKIR